MYRILRLVGFRVVFTSKTTMPIYIRTYDDTLEVITRNQIMQCYVIKKKLIRILGVGDK